MSRDRRAREQTAVWIWISRILRSLIGIAAIVIAVGLFGYLASSREAPKHRTDAASLPVVRAVRIAPKPIARHWTGYGTARAMNASDVAAEVAGRVVERTEGLEAGVSVAEGDVLVQLDPTDYEQRVRAAERSVESIEAQLSGLEIEEARLGEQAELLREELEVARRDYERARDAFDRGAGNESQVDARLQAVKAATRSLAAISSQLEVIPSRRASLNASLDSARADLRLAEENLARTTVRAPFAGVLQSIDVEAGEWARAGDVVARVVDLSRIEVPLRLPQAAAASIGAGDAATLRTEGSLNKAWPASVSRIAPESDAATRSLTVYVEVRQRPGAASSELLRPGQFVMGEVVSGEAAPTLVVPRDSVNTDTVLIVTAPDEHTPEPPAGATRPMVVREATVSVSHYREGVFADIAPNETQWAVLHDERVAGGDTGVRGVRPGDLVLVTKLESLRPGDLVDVRIEGDGEIRAASDGGETGTEAAP